MSHTSFSFAFAKRPALAGSLAAALATAWGIAPLAAADAPNGDDPSRYNIVFLLADDWRFDTLGAADHPVLKTPHLDRLAGEGFRFTHSCVTTSICGVSRSSFLSGQWMTRHGNRSFRSMETPWALSYPALLRENGYYTGHVGKWHSGPFPEDEFDFGRMYHGRHWVKREDGSRVHVTRKNQEDALDFLAGRPRDRPFMLNVWFFAPHAEDGHEDQYLPQPESRALYEDVEIPVPRLHSDEALRALPEFIQAPENEGRVRYHWRFDTPEKYQRMMKNYYRLCSEVDAVCGRVMEELEKQGVLDETIVVFAGDNGYYHGDRKLADKWYPHEESIRVPLIVHDPRMPESARGKTNDDFVLNVDLAPMLLGAAGVEVPDSMQGRDFSPLYREPGADHEWREEFFYEHPTITRKERIPSSQAVVRKDLKYVWWPEWEHEELFDLREDPLELVNLAEDPDYADRLETLRLRLKEMHAAVR
jgi:arylsulfatase A-like enzyme